MHKNDKIETFNFKDNKLNGIYKATLLSMKNHTLS